MTALASSQFAASAIRFLYMLAIARMLGPEQTGVYLYGMALYLSVIRICQFGQNVFLAQRIGKHRGIPLPILHHSLTLTLSATLVVAAGLVLFVWITEPEFTLRLVVLCFVGAMFFRAMVIWVRGVYVAFEHPGWIPRYEIIFRGTEALIGVAALYSGGSLLAVSFLHFLFWAAEAGCSLRKLAGEYPDTLRLGCRRDYLKKVTAVSLLFLISTTAIAQFPQISIVLLRKLQPDGAFVGHFGLAMQFMTALMIIPMAATQAFLPRLSRSYSHGYGGGDLITAVKLVGGAALAGAVIAAAYGPWCITWILGNDYAEAAELFRQLCWVFTPYTVAILLSECLNVINGRGKAVAITVGMTAIHSVLLILYVDQSPTIAAVGSMLLATAICMLIAMSQVSRQLELQGNIWWKKFVLLLVAAYTVFETDWAPLMITAPAALATAAVTGWLLRFFNTDDIDAFRRLIGR